MAPFTQGSLLVLGFQNLRIWRETFWAKGAFCAKNAAAAMLEQ
jgi:hypothetical protein